jgi:integrase
LLYKRGKVWWIKLKWTGRTIRRSTGTGSRELARRIEAKILRELEEGEWFEKDLAEKLLFREVWERYLKEDAMHKAVGTYQRALQCGRNFIPLIGDLPLRQITPSVLSHYRAKRIKDEVTLSTVNKELQCIRRVFSLCKRDWQLVRQSPFEHFRIPTDKAHRVKFLGKGQFESLLLNCPAWLRPMVTLARYTGMRRGNILSLAWDQVDLENRLIHLESTKNGLPLTIPLIDASYDVLVSMRGGKVARLGCPYVFQEGGKPFSPHKVSMAFKRAAQRAGLPNFRFHDLRHDFASHLVQGGTDLYVVQHLLGHKDGRMTQRYAHLRVDNLRQALRVLDGGYSGGHKKGHSNSEKGVAASATP